MSVTRITPDEAATLLEQGWKIIDVRSIPEFEEGHPSGAYNVPINHRTAQGATPNDDFLAVMRASFDTDARLITLCRSGGRSLRAATLLASNGFTNVMDMRGGFAGETSGATVTCAGWEARGLPVASKAEAGCSYEELKAKK